MVESKKVVVNSHKDIETLVEGWEGFTLDITFCDMAGFCMSVGTVKDRRSLEEPHEPSGQIYRFLKGDYEEDSHRYGLVTGKGEVLLSARLGFSGRSCYGQDIEKFAKKYSELKKHLERAGVDYTPDAEFEQSIIGASRILEE